MLIPTTFPISVSYPPPSVGIVGISVSVLLGMHWLVLVGISVGITLVVDAKTVDVEGVVVFNKVGMRT